MVAIFLKKSDENGGRYGRYYIATEVCQRGCGHHTTRRLQDWPQGDYKEWLICHPDKSNVLSIWTPIACVQQSHWIHCFQALAIELREEYLSKVEKRVQSYEVKVLNEPRPGKKLLVLDIDYTLFDHRSVAECGAELMRPYLHEFLTSAYQVRVKTYIL